MDPLYRDALRRSVFGIIFFVVLFYFASGTWSYWQGWLFLVVFTAATAGFTVYMALFDRPLLERRMKAGPGSEKETSQKIIITLVMASFFVFILLPVLDYRFNFSRVPAWLSVLGDGLVLLSFFFIFYVLRYNSWAASNIRVENDQKVIDTGPYAYVRHPMYAGAIWMFVGIPLALGSWWSIFLTIPFLPILLWRLLDEERILRRDLPGYDAYTDKVRFRLIPGIY